MVWQSLGTAQSTKQFVCHQTNSSAGPTLFESFLVLGLTCPVSAYFPVFAGEKTTTGQWLSLYSGDIRVAAQISACFGIQSWLNLLIFRCSIRSLFYTRTDILIYR